MNILDKIIELLEKQNRQQKDLTDFLGLEKSTFSAWKSKKSSSYKKYLPEIANFFKISIDELTGNQTKRVELSNISQIIPSDKIYKIPVFASVSAGFGALAEEDVIEYMPVVIDNPYDVPNMLGIRVHGNSMYPKIEDVDIVIVRKQESVDSGSIAVILIDGEEGVVKKVLYGDDWIELHSINPEYMPRRFEGAEVERLRVVGLVKGTFKMF